MQVLEHKAAVDGLEVSLRGIGIGLCDPVELVEEADGRIAVIFRRRSWNPFARIVARIGGRVPGRRLGYLAPAAAGLVAPALQADCELRVRVVDLTPAHLHPAGRDTLDLSIRADRKQLARARDPEQVARPVPPRPVLAAPRGFEAERRVARRA